MCMYGEALKCKRCIKSVDFYDYLWFSTVFSLRTVIASQLILGHCIRMEVSYWRTHFILKNYGNLIELIGI